ncbi:MAG: DUF4249 domain-containing protein [Candidatus Cyclobacteriaceae bacterium M3_2C_046]
MPKNYQILGLVLTLLTSCQLVKDIDVELPSYQSKLVLECYLEPGKPVRAFLSESTGYFDHPQVNEIKDAQVYIANDQLEIPLSQNSLHDQDMDKYYNYVSDWIVHLDTETNYQIRVEDKNGRSLHGTTGFMPVVPIDTMEYRYNGDSLAYVLVRFEDDPLKKNYYRFTLHKGNLGSGPKQDFVFDDQFFDSPQSALGSGFDFAPGDTAIATLYHLEETYYDFYQSMEASKNANYNPFAQPTAIKSTIEGGIGVFTALSYDRKIVILK